MNIRNENQPAWQHDHTFGQDRRRPGELRTLVVVLLTVTTMVLEIVAGIVYGSMAVLADGLHMASHALALAISLFAYIYARRNAYNDRFSFGTGKVNSLAGFTGAILLALFALAMAWASCHRIIEPVPIAFNQAIVVAFLGLLVNGMSVIILGGGHSHQNGNQHEEADESSDSQHHGGREHDHNLRSAYLHVLADALTSLLAIVALLAGKYLGLNWLDPVMGIAGAVLVGIWRNRLREAVNLTVKTTTLLVGKTTLGSGAKSHRGQTNIQQHVEYKPTSDRLQLYVAKVSSIPHWTH